MHSQKTEGPPEELTATVGKLRGEGDGKFVITYPTVPIPPPFVQGDNITFTLSDWTGSEEPRKGEVVRLSEVRLFAKGWRALKACSAVTSHKPEEGR